MSEADRLLALGPAHAHDLALFVQTCEQDFFSKFDPKYWDRLEDSYLGSLNYCVWTWFWWTGSFDADTAQHLADYVVMTERHRRVG